MLPKPKAVLFDWDNTLVNTWPIIHGALHKTFVEMGVEPWSFETTKTTVRRSMRDSFPDIFGVGWEKASDIYQQAYQATHLVHLEALPQAEDLLRFIKEQGIFSAVVSNKKGHNLRKELAHIGWEHYFDKVVGADDAARDKPHPDPVHMAIEGANITLAPEVWFIGDSEIDLECAENVGVTAVLYGDAKLDKNGHFNGFKFRHHVQNHEELMQLFRAALK